MPTYPLLALARTTGNPIIENETAFILWQGKTPALFVDDTHNWEEDPQQMVHTAPGIWVASLQLPLDAYLEYGFIDPVTGKRLVDPYNPNRVWNGMGDWNHYFYMPGGSPSDLTRAVRGRRKGKVTSHRVETKGQAGGRERIVHLYQPPVPFPVPLLVVLDGVDYLKRGKLNVIVDNLIYMKRIRPIAMAFVQNGGASRFIEYSCSDATIDFLFNQVIPLAQEHLTLTPPGGEAYGILGASMGGLMALYCGLRLPHVFGKVLSQSGAFFLPDQHSVMPDLVRHQPHSDLRIWMDAGKLEFLLEGNREMVALLKEMKYNLTYREYPGGHNYTSWSNDIGRGLEKLFRELSRERATSSP